ncbi:hypothetical protein DdX_18574 [Ditylenchus destructor]|uniref:Uncharacterized protein n=1 Tax=Ditylenchus destructor TaxID=166010 RepID=A0AAD4MKX7_9BILA|nr:hypothetical protein DdX_18574 [Ditylenchus destructor]
MQAELINKRWFNVARGKSWVNFNFLMSKDFEWVRKKLHNTDWTWIDATSFYQFKNMLKQLLTRCGPYVRNVDVTESSWLSRSLCDVLFMLPNAEQIKLCQLHIKNDRLPGYRRCLSDLRTFIADDFMPGSKDYLSNLLRLCGRLEVLSIESGCNGWKEPIQRFPPLLRCLSLAHAIVTGHVQIVPQLSARKREPFLEHSGRINKMGELNASNFASIFAQFLEFDQCMSNDQPAETKLARIREHLAQETDQNTKTSQTKKNRKNKNKKAGTSQEDEEPISEDKAEAVETIKAENESLRQKLKEAIKAENECQKLENELENERQKLEEANLFTSLLGKKPEETCVIMRLLLNLQMAQRQNQLNPEVSEAFRDLDLSGAAREASTETVDDSEEKAKRLQDFKSEQIEQLCQRFGKGTGAFTNNDGTVNMKMLLEGWVLISDLLDCFVTEFKNLNDVIKQKPGGFQNANENKMKEVFSHLELMAQNQTTFSCLLTEFVQHRRETADGDSSNDKKQLDEIILAGKPITERLTGTKAQIESLLSAFGEGTDATSDDPGNSVGKRGKNKNKTGSRKGKK